MQPNRIQDLAWRGLGVSARKLGTPHDAFRPAGAVKPLDGANRYLRLPALFSAEHRHFARPAGFGEALRWGMFDAAYTRPGDYLVGADGTYYIAAQQSYAPILCVRAERVITIARTTAPAANAYGGITTATRQVLLADWPAAINLSGGSSRPTADLPADGGNASWNILLPQLPATLRSADLVSDDLGRNFVVLSAEKSDLGWRLAARQAGT